MEVKVKTRSGSEYRFFESSGYLRLARNGKYDIRVRHIVVGDDKSIEIIGSNFFSDNHNDYSFTSTPVTSIEIIEGTAGEKARDLQVIVTTESGVSYRFYQLKGQLICLYGRKKIHVKKIEILEGKGFNLISTSFVGTSSPIKSIKILEDHKSNFTRYAF